MFHLGYEQENQLLRRAHWASDGSSQRQASHAAGVDDHCSHHGRGTLSFCCVESCVASIAECNTSRFVLEPDRAVSVLLSGMITPQTRKLAVVWCISLDTLRFWKLQFGWSCNLFSHGSVSVVPITSQLKQPVSVSNSVVGCLCWNDILLCCGLFHAECVVITPDVRVIRFGKSYNRRHSWLQVGFEILHTVEYYWNQWRNFPRRSTSVMQGKSFPVCWCSGTMTWNLSCMDLSDASAESLLSTGHLLVHDTWQQCCELGFCQIHVHLFYSEQNKCNCKTNRRNKRVLIQIVSITPD